MIHCFTSLKKYDDSVMRLELDEYRRLCERRQSVFEKLPDDLPIKLYADFDYKAKKHAGENSEFYNSTEQLVILAKQAFGKKILQIGGTEEPIFCVKVATSEKDEIISFHLIVSNYTMMKREQLEFMKAVNAEIDNNTTDLWHRDYISVSKQREEAGFFDTAIYDSGRKIRSVYSTKEDESRHFELTEGTFEDSVISIINRDVQELHIDIPEKCERVDYTPSETDGEQINAYIDAGFFKKLAEPYDTWRNMGFAIFNVLGNAGLPIFKKFSKLCPLKYDADKVESFWDSIERRPDGKLTLGSINYWAKRENPEEYERIQQIFRKKREDVNLFITPPDVEESFNCATIISKTICNHLIRCKEKWYALTNENLWQICEEPTFYIMREIRKYIDYSIVVNSKKIASTSGEEKERNIKLGESYLKLYRYIGGTAYLSVITRNLKVFLNDNTFSDKLDATTGILAFKNGIVDLKTGQFRKGILSNDFISDTIPHDYSAANSTGKEFVKSVLLKILNNNHEHLEYFLSIIGYTFIGESHREKSIYFCIDKTTQGKGDNGKSLFFEILTKLMPNYVCKSKSVLFEDGNTKLHKYLAGLKGKRLLWIDEYSKKKANAELLKSIGDGTPIQNEVMFGTMQFIEVMFKAFILSNHLINIDPNESAVFNRAKQISFGSHFDRTGKLREDCPDSLCFRADTTLMDTLIRDYKDSIFGLIVEYAGLYYIRRLPDIPEQFVADTKETQLANDDFAQWFEEHMETGEEFRISCKQLSYLTGKDGKSVQEAMKRLGFKYDKQLHGLGKDNDGKHIKGGFIGCRFIEESIED